MSHWFLSLMRIHLGNWDVSSRSLMVNCHTRDCMKLYGLAHLVGQGSAKIRPPNCLAPLNSFPRKANIILTDTVNIIFASHPSRLFGITFSALFVAGV